MTAAGGTTAFDDGITAVDTDYLRPQQDASHLIVEGGRAAFVDTGTNFSVPNLLAALSAADLDVGDVDWVFLTHVHLDHAGGAGLLTSSLPNARAVVHPRGARHMIDPSRLVAGTKAVYGERRYAEMYGELLPIPPGRLVEAADGDRFELAGRPFATLHTEGHARHHYCLHDPQAAAVFTGDSFGVSYRELDTANGEFVFPTTTPVHFDPEEAHRAVERIMACEPDWLYLTHYSRVPAARRLADDMHRGIDDFVALARENAAADDRSAAISGALFDYLAGRARAHGVAAGDDWLHDVLDMDVNLNTQGLEHWLDHGSPGR